MALQTGTLIDDKYRVGNPIGEGGMGTVYEGCNERIDRRVAIKVLHPVHARNAEAVHRFELEAQAAGRIGDDHIVEVLDVGGDGCAGIRYMVMEYLEGETLSDRIRRVGRLSPEKAAQIALQILSGLDAAHAAGIVHRDLKPENIFIVREKAEQADFVKIIDFGISKFADLSFRDRAKTNSRILIGTPSYLAPEQALGQCQSDLRSDLYAVGVILYECVTGQVPFDAPNYHALLFKIAYSDPAAPESSVPGLDPSFSALLRKAMARNIDERFQSAREFGMALQQWLEMASNGALASTSTTTGRARTHRYFDSARSTQRRCFAERDTRRLRARSDERPWAARPALHALLIAAQVALAIGGLIATFTDQADAHNAEARLASAAGSPLDVEPPRAAVPGQDMAKSPEIDERYVTSTEFRREDTKLRRAAVAVTDTAAIKTRRISTPETHSENSEKNRQSAKPFKEDWRGRPDFGY